MLAKAERELARMDNAETLDDERDAALNCALGRWHMSDWACKTLREEKRNDIKAFFGEKSGQVKVNHVNSWVRKNCQEAELVQAMATAAKHVNFDYHNTFDPDRTPPSQYERGSLSLIDKQGNVVLTRLALQKLIYFWKSQIGEIEWLY